MVPRTNVHSKDGEEWGDAGELCREWVSLEGGGKKTDASLPSTAL